jgi:transposase
MSNASQKRALQNYRERLSKRGLARFEVLGLDSDRELIRSLARRLAENDQDAARLRAEVSKSVSPEEPKKGGMLDWLRRSPLVGADLEFPRETDTGHSVEF